MPPSEFGDFGPSRLRGVAQLGRALRSGRRGHRFKSCRPDHFAAGAQPELPYGTPLFSRFSPAARRVLRAAEQECRNHNHYYVGSEHMLYALLEEHDVDLEARLAGEGVEPSRIHAELKRALGTGEGRSWEGILVTPRVRKIVQIADQLAGDREVEPIDLFEAIRTEGGGLAADILRRACNN